MWYIHTLLYKFFTQPPHLLGVGGNMAKRHNTSVWLMELTHQQIDTLIKSTGLSQTAIITLLIDRLYRQLSSDEALDLGLTSIPRTDSSDVPPDKTET